MSYKKICDLCGKEMTSFDECRKFKIKEHRYSIWTQWKWVRIDAHDECVRRLFEAVKIKLPTPMESEVQKEEEFKLPKMRYADENRVVHEVHKENTIDEPSELGTPIRDFMVNPHIEVST